MPVFRPILLVLLVLLVIGLPAFAQDAPDTELVVFAAASLTDAFTTIGDAFEAENPHVTVQFNFAGSSTLAAQIGEGAPADVFASANEKQMGVAIETNRIDADAAHIFATNSLVIAVPMDNPAGIESMDDLAKPGILLVLAAPAVPVRDYTDIVLARYDELVDADYQEQVMANLISEESNVRQVVAKIALGEVDAGIVYRSDITPDLAEAVMTIPIPEAINVTASYPIAPLNDTEQPEQAAAFVAFVMGESGQAILIEWGLCPFIAEDDAIPNPDEMPEATAEATDEPTIEDSTNTNGCP